MFKSRVWLCTKWAPDLYTCTARDPGGKMEQKTRRGLRSSSRCNNLSQRTPPAWSVPWPHSLRGSQLTSCPKLTPTQARVTHDSPLSSAHPHPPPPHPSSYGCNNRPRGLKCTPTVSARRPRLGPVKGAQHKDFSFLSLCGSARSWTLSQA